MQGTAYYDGNQRVTYERAAAGMGTRGSGGCTTCGGGGGSGSDRGDAYAYYTNPNGGTPADPYNSWQTRTTVTHADGTEDVVYTNTFGGVMLKLFCESAAGGSNTVRAWGTAFRYDSHSHVLSSAQPSAVAVPTTNGSFGTSGASGGFATLEGANDGAGTYFLLGAPASGNANYIAASGLINVRTYFQDSDGAITGEVKSEAVQQGAAGAPVIVRSYTYVTHTYADATTGTTMSINRPASMTEYPTAGGAGNTTSYTYTLFANSTQVSQRVTTLPSVAAGHNGSGTANTMTELFDKLGNTIWMQDERGYITRTYYTLRSGSNLVYKGTVQEQIGDVQMSQMGSDPTDPVYNPTLPSWSTPTGGGLHLVTDCTWDDLSRLIQVLGPSHTADVSGTPTAVRTAAWTVYNEAGSGDRVWTCGGYATGTAGSYTYASVGPVMIAGYDKAGNVTDNIVAQRSTTSGALTLTSGDAFPVSSWQRWTNTGYDSQHQKTYTRLYRLIPTNGSTDTLGTNYDETDYGFDTMGRMARVKRVDSGSSKGTATRTVYDLEGRVTATWVGTQDVPTDGTGCWCDWPAHTTSVDLVQVSSTVYDQGNAGGDGLVTSQTQIVDANAADNRVWTYGYDFRDRRTSGQGPAVSDVVGQPSFNTYDATTYDNLGQTVQVDRFNSIAAGNLIGRAKTYYDEVDRAYQTAAYAVTPATGAVGNALVSNTWYDPAGNMVKTNAAGAGGVFNKTVYDGAERVTKRYVSYDPAEQASDYPSALAVTGDTVVQQSETAYDAAGNAVQSTVRERLDGDSGTGDLTTMSGGQTAARVTNAATWYDPIGRPVAMADYGTNGDGALVRPDAIPARSDAVLLSSTAYDPAGEAWQGTDPRALLTQTTFDNAGRKLSVVEDVNGAARTTSYTYTPDGLVGTMTAVNAGTGNQTTTYAYGSTTAESGVARSTLLRAVVYPDSDDVASPLGNGSDGVYNRVELTYDRLGEVLTRRDNDQSVHAYDYDALGRVVNDRVTAFGAGVDATVQRITRTYETRGMPVGTLSYTSAAVGSGTVLNDDERTYNGFGQLTADAQSHSGAVVSGTTPQTAYAYDAGTANEVRPTSLTYPNGRVLYYGYNNAGDAAGVSAAINRVSALCSAASRGTGDANVIAAYNYVGAGHAYAVQYPTPALALTYGNAAAGATSFPGWDAFSRVATQAWTPTGTGSAPTFSISYGYDRDGNRLYAANAAYPGASQVYGYDTLNRLGQYKAGLINAGNTDTQAYWTRSGQRWTLDATGNPTATDEWDNGSGGFANWRQGTYDKANKLTATAARANLAKSPRTDPFTASATAANWAKPGSGDAFNVNTSNAGNLTVTAVARDTVAGVQEAAAQAPLFWGPPMGGGYAVVTGVFPSGTAAGQLGVTFGGPKQPPATGGLNYWTQVYDLDGHLKTYQQGSAATLQTSGSYPGITAGSNQGMVWLMGRRRLWVTPTTDYPTSGTPSGSVGLFANVAGTKFTGYKLWDDADSRNLAGRWTDWAPNADGVNAVVPAASGNAGRLRFSANPYSNTRPAMLSNLRLQRFQAVFNVKRESSATSNSVDFIFNGGDLDAFDTVQVYHSNTKAAPHGHVQPDGSDGPVSSETQTTANVPATGASDVLWVQVTADGTGSVTAKEQVNNAGTPTAASWGSVANCYSSTAFRSTGGMVGFKGESSAVSVGSLTVSSWNTSTSAYDVVEAYEPFGVNTTAGSTYGFASDTPTSDANGNLLYDGSQVYTYDAWNRLKTVSHGYRDASGTLQHGQAFDTMGYDGRGRRVTKAVLGTGQWDCAYHYYLTGDRVIEERNNSNQTAKQFVWGQRYTDELVQTSVNSNPFGQSTCDVAYWACPDANWNVTAIVSASGATVERYEYTPYGQRQVFYSAGSNDLAGYAPTVGSRRVATSGSVTQAWGICEVGHQGLLHDEECGLVYNRARLLSSDANRFTARDPEGYSDSANLYRYEVSNPICRTDPTGKLSWAQYYYYKGQAKWYTKLYTHKAEEGLNDCMTCSFHDAWLGRQAANVAEQTTTLLFSRVTSNGRDNAFKHCMWSCTMSKVVGQKCAKFFGEEHEREGDKDGQTPADNVMDTSNNAYGRDLAWRQENGEEGDCKSGCLKATKAWELVVNDGLSSYILPGN